MIKLFKKWRLNRIIRRAAREMQTIQYEREALSARYLYNLKASGAARAELLKLQLKRR